MELLAKEDPEFTHPPNNAKETPLYLAAERQHMNMVSMILKNRTSPAYGGPMCQTALHAAAKSTKLLLEWKSNQSKKTDEYRWISLHYATRYANEYEVKRILKKDKSEAYITTDEEGDEMTAFHIAADNGNVAVMEEHLLCCPDCWEMDNGKGQNEIEQNRKERRDTKFHLPSSSIMSSTDTSSLTSLFQTREFSATRLLWKWSRKRRQYILQKSWIIYLINQKDIEGNTPLHLLATALGSKMPVDL
ncbi:hypothetical protein HYC85_003352 [Camellia sinensis]|uniref:PGG domain-containing protein n=1 Tax=Camellia sinensis TaxID=4442 RepID=A0A7J7IB19_CAMSI|nr:hypothetical protein HYC85_003352 [Camellia sinensis]